VAKIEIFFSEVNMRDLVLILWEAKNLLIFLGG